jgi:hypothetical protein
VLFGITVEFPLPWGREKTTVGVSPSGLRSHQLEILPFTQHVTFIEPHTLRVARPLRYENPHRSCCSSRGCLLNKKRGGDVARL